MANLQIIRWDDIAIEVNFSQEGSPIDLTWYTVFFTVKGWDDDWNTDEHAIIKKTFDTFEVGWDDPTQWKIHIILTHDDTAVEIWDYKRDLQLKSPEWLISSIEAWSFLVIDDVTKRIDLPNN